MAMSKTPQTSAPEVEYREIPFELETSGEDKKFTGRGRAIVSRIGAVDSYKDVIEPGAFSASRSEVPMLPNHSWESDSPPVGMMKVKEEGKEVIGEFRLNMDLQLAQDWAAHLKFAKKQQFSIGFRTVKARYLTDEEMEERKDGAWRLIEKLDLKEVSMVVAGAMPRTKLLELRSEERKAAINKDEGEEAPAEEAKEEEVEIPGFDEFMEHSFPENERIAYMKRELEGI